MNAPILLLTILSLIMHIFGEETKVEKQDKRGTLGLSQGGYRDSFHGNPLAIGADYGQTYLGTSLDHGISTPAYSYSYSNAPLYSSHRLDYSRNLGYGGFGHGYRPDYVTGGLDYAGTRLGYGAAGLGYDAAGLGYNMAKLGYNTAGFGYGARLGHGTGYSTAYSTGYRNGW